jgi:putative transposase
MSSLAGFATRPPDGTSGHRENGNTMRRSKIRAYLHIVWATQGRMPFVTPEVEEAVYRCIQDEVQGLGCDVLAIGGMPDHVHLVVAFTSLHSFSKFVQQVKGVSSRFAKDLPATGGIFSWQEGYALFTLSPNHVERAVTYVQHQKQHHASNHVWTDWEETDEEAPGGTTEKMASK